MDTTFGIIRGALLPAFRAPPIEVGGVENPVHAGASDGASSQSIKEFLS
jgi:hypothetical protein